MFILRNKIIWISSGFGDTVIMELSKSCPRAGSAHHWAFIRGKLINSYEQFFDLFPKDNFFDFGLNNIITIDFDKATIEWEELMHRVKNKSSDLYVRSFGRQGTGNEKLKALYRDVFEININIDRTNNQKPKSMLQNLTGYRVNKTIFNYQISHVYGRTKKRLLFHRPLEHNIYPEDYRPIYRA